MERLNPETPNRGATRLSPSPSVVKSDGSPAASAAAVDQSATSKQESRSSDGQQAQQPYTAPSTMTDHPQAPLPPIPTKKPLPQPDPASHGLLPPPPPPKHEPPPPPPSHEAPTADHNPSAAERTSPQRFATKDEETGEPEDSTLMDHQTFLEKYLDDSFFGDWYHNTGIIIFACLASWFVAVVGGGLGWIIIVMATCGTYYRTSSRRTRRNYRDDLNRQLSKQRLETDHESLEWINSFLVKFWPIYSPVISQTMIDSVDQVLSNSTPAFLDNLRLKKFELGSKPPRLEYVKTYPRTEPEIVMMDWKFSFTPMDVMDLTARQLKDKTNPKVILEVRVGKGVVSKGLDVIVEDFQVTGLMRVKMKLQLPFPHMEKVDVCFLGRPEFDYVCKPIGGDILGFDSNFIPGLGSFIQEQIHATLEPMMYDPNVFSVEIAKMLTAAVDQPIGVVAVTLHGAFNLRNPDRFSGLPDPYATVGLNHQEALGKTKTVHDNANPRWNETIFVTITTFTDTLTLHVFDWNEFRKDKELGTATFALDQLETNPEHPNLSLDALANGRSRGTLNADISYFPVLTGRTLEDGSEEPAPLLNTGIIRLVVEQAQDLDGSRSLVGALNPYAVILLNGQEVKISEKLKRTNKPIFQHASKDVIIHDRRSARLGIVLKDDRDVLVDPIIGTYNIKLQDLLHALEKGQDWFNLRNATTGRVKLRCIWQPVALRGDLGGSGGYVNPIGVVRLHLVRATNLRNLEAVGKSDAYARVSLGGIEVGRTVTFQNNLDPEFNEVIYVPVHSRNEKIVVEMLDEERLGKDRPLGHLDIPVSGWVRERDDGTYERDDEKQVITSGLRLGKSTAHKGDLVYSVAFYPTLDTVDPEEDEEEAKAQDAMAQIGLDSPPSPVSTKPKSLHETQNTEKQFTPNGDGADTKSISSTTNRSIVKTDNGSIKDGRSQKDKSKILVTPENVHEYGAGLVVFKIHEVELPRSDVYLEVCLDDHVFPSYTSMKLSSKHTVLNDVGDAFVRELEASEITLRLVEESDSKGEEEGTRVFAKLTGPTLPTLQNCLYQTTQLVLRDPEAANHHGDNNGISKITVSMKYIPVDMILDPEESINNSGTLRVDVLDATDLPSADRNGYSDPYCRFILDGKDVFKTKVQKKTLHPAWNEFFETQVHNRIRADFLVDVYDWDFGAGHHSHDHLGIGSISLADLEPFGSKEVHVPLVGKDKKGQSTHAGLVRLKLLFRPQYVVRWREASSTFSGTFAVPGKIVGAPVKGVGFVGGAVGGGVLKGAGFLKRGFKSRIRSGSKHSGETVEED